MQFLPTPITKVPLTPLIGDVLVVEHVDTKVAGNATHPTYGDAHPNTARWPDHKFCWAEAGEKGLQTWHYVADRATQHLYNWEQDDAKEWPSVKQTFLIPRAEFAAGGVTYAPPDHLSEDYVVTATTQVRSDMAKLDNLYVVVLVEREDTSALQLGQEFDADTGTLRVYSKQKVPAGTAGSFDPETGTIEEVQPINPFWSIRTTKQAQGLAGNAADGLYTRPSYYIITNYSWPGVLDAGNPFNVFRPPLKAGGYDTAIVTHNYWRHPYDGPCVAEIIEEWTQDPPAVTTIGSTMLPKEIRWQGRLFDVYVPPTLHHGLLIEENSGTDHPKYAYYYFQQRFPSTYPTDWPTYVDSDKTVRPFFGGYLSRKVRVYNPHVYELASTILLSVIESTDTTLRLSWATGVAGDSDVFIRVNGEEDWPEDPEATTSGATYLITGLTAGVSYDVQVINGSVESNIVETNTMLGVPVISGTPFTCEAFEALAIDTIDVDATGGSIVFSASGLLAGLAIDAETGEVTGTPTGAVSGSFTGYVTATNDVGADTESIAFDYTAKPTITPGQTPSHSASSPGVSDFVAATNDPTSWALGSDPDDFFPDHEDMIFDTDTGEIWGDLGVATGTYTLNFTATNAAGTRAAVAVTYTVTSPE